MGSRVLHSTAAASPDPESYRATECALMMTAFANGSPQPVLELSKIEGSPEGNIQFVNYFRDQIFPIQNQLRQLFFESRWHQIASDRALYSDSAQNEEWLSKKVDREKQIEAILNGEEWKQKVDEWAKLAGQSQGSLAIEARRLARSSELHRFDAQYIPRLNELSELDTKINQIANESDFAKNLEEVAATIESTRQAYLSGKMPLQFASMKIEAARAKGEQGLSRDIGAKAGSQLNRTAEIRTQLAKSKGYKSWSEYQVAIQAEVYTDAFNSVDARIQFLKSALQKTDAALENLLQSLTRPEEGIAREDLRESHVILLQPGIDSFGKYFPRENINKLLTTTLLASGFQPKDFNKIVRDSYPRPNKYSHAYMSSLNVKVPRSLKIDVSLLEASPPAIEWFSSQIYIVESMLSDSIYANRTSFHETGHGLHYLNEEDEWNWPTSSSYVETHSTTLEHFFFDHEFLEQNAITREGKRPSKDEIETYFKNSKIAEFILYRQMMSRALFELKLWNIDYTQTDQKFVERAVQLYGEIISRGTGVKGSEDHGVDSAGRGPLNAPHFRAGRTGYIGYVLAGNSAFLTIKSLLDSFEKETGRRSLFQQPTLASKLIDGYYRLGYRKPFPESVEKFTGFSFSMDSFLNFLTSE